MNIAIVDDLLEERLDIKKHIDMYFMQHATQYQIKPEFEEFESGEVFLSCFQPNRYDLIILDIYMDDLDGIETAKKLIIWDKHCKLVFFTSSTDHLLEGYGVHALGYILKPLSLHQKSLYKLLDYIVDLLELDQKGVLIRSSAGEQYVPFKTIVYLESSVRNLYVHMPGESIRIQGTYAEYVPLLLQDERFLETYRNLTVNMDFIERPDEKDFLLKTGEKVPISRRKKTEVLERYTQYFIKRRGF